MELLGGAMGYTNRMQDRWSEGIDGYNWISCDSLGGSHSWSSGEGGREWGVGMGYVCL